MFNVHLKSVWICKRKNLVRKRHDFIKLSTKTGRFHVLSVGREEVDDALMRKLASAQTNLFHCHVVFVLLVAFRFSPNTKCFRVGVLSGFLAEFSDNVDCMSRMFS